VELAHWVPADHRNFITRAVSLLARDARVDGIAAGGSMISGPMDEYSDVDLIVVVSEATLPFDTLARKEIAEALGPLLTSFTAEHVGEPRLLICLYGPPLLKVDLKFIVADDLNRRIEDPVILHDPSGVIERTIQTSEAFYPMPNRQRIEDAFWVWVQYSAAKIRRGELFEAMALLNFLIEKVLGPYALLESGQNPSGVRRIERFAPDRAAALARLHVPYDRRAIKTACQEAAALYVSLRKDVVCRREAEHAALIYLAGC